jgi:hypothetical protein
MRARTGGKAHSTQPVSSTSPVGSISVESRTVLRRSFAALAALTLAIGPAWSAHAARSGPVRADPITVWPGAPQALIATGTSAPEAEIRPTDERDPSPPLPASADLGVLLLGAALSGVLLGRASGRIQPLRWALVHVPRAPPSLSTI